MRMHSAPAARPPLRRSTAGSFASAGLPLLLATVGMLVIGVALILNLGILVLAGAGLAVIGTATYLIIAGLDRADRRQVSGASPAQDEPATHGTRGGLPPRGPLADAAVDALTRSDGPGGVWPPLSNQPLSGNEKPVAMWDPHGDVTPPSFQDPPRTHSQQTPSPQGSMNRHRAYASGANEQDAMVEFTSVEAPTGPESHTPWGNTNPVDDARRPPSTQWEQEPQGERDHRMWPGASDLGHWENMSGGQHNKRMSDERRMASMKERRERLAERLPTVGAILASPEKDDAPPKSGATRGKCSSCDRYIWAPPTRPITLKCPGCGHKARLY